VVSVEDIFLLEFGEVESSRQSNGIQHPKGKTNFILQPTEETTQVILVRDTTEMIRKGLELGGILSHRSSLPELHPRLHRIVVNRLEASEQGLQKSLPCRELPHLIGVLKPDQHLTFHVKGCHADTLIQRRLVIVKELVDLIRPNQTDCHRQSVGNQGAGCELGYAGHQEENHGRHRLGPGEEHPDHHVHRTFPTRAGGGHQDPPQMAVVLGLAGE
jgi:hypothetical protein